MKKDTRGLIVHGVCLLIIAVCTVIKYLLEPEVNGPMILIVICVLVAAGIFLMDLYEYKKK